MIDTTQFEGHTPGPWNAYITGTVCANHQDNPWVFGEDVLSSEADARLIAAAPDLLAEVERLRKAIEILLDAYERRMAGFPLEYEVEVSAKEYALAAIDAAGRE